MTAEATFLCQCFDAFCTVRASFRITFEGQRCANLIVGFFAHRPNQSNNPADNGPTEKQVQDKNSIDILFVANFGDNGWNEVWGDYNDSNTASQAGNTMRAFKSES